MFFCSCLCYFCAIYIANVAQRTFEIVQKSRSCDNGDIIILTKTYVDCARARVPRLPRARYIPSDISRKLQLTLCAIIAS